LIECCNGSVSNTITKGEKNMNRKFAIILLATAGALGGCASNLQSTDELQSATAFSLGLEAADVTISNRQDSGMTTNYWATTRSGRKYSCVRTAGISIMGAIKSSPLCNPTNAKAEAAPQPSNALTDAYKQQQKSKTK